MVFNAAGDDLGRVDFTGHSLGGALAQYAAYDYAKQQEDAAAGAGQGWVPSDHIDLVTFNALGGFDALQSHEDGGYQDGVLAGLAGHHFAVRGDIVSRLGGGSMRSARASPLRP